MALANAGRHDNHPNRRRRRADRWSDPLHAGGSGGSCRRGSRRSLRAGQRAPDPTRSRAARCPHAQARRTQALPAVAGDARVLPYAHRPLDRRRSGAGPGARPGRGRRRVPDQALLAARPHGPRQIAASVGVGMAGEVALSQALAYARDLKSAFETARAREQELIVANDRLRKGYQQSLQYAVDLKRTHRQLQRSIFQSLLGLANALEAKDAYTSGHSSRVSRFARDLALAAGLSQTAAETVAQAGLLHDLGKISVPESILSKPGALTQEEWEIMRRHPVISA